MLAASHAIAGALIASQAGSPDIAIMGALISHPLLDLFPHWDFETRHTKRSMVLTIAMSLADSFAGFAIGFLLFYKTVDPILLLIAMFAAQLPDYLEAPYRIFNWKFPPFNTIKRLQSLWHTKLDWPWGFIPQIALLAIAVYFSFTA